MCVVRALGGERVAVWLIYLPVILVRAISRGDIASR